MALAIDLAARARLLSDEQFRVWARGQTVFISSVMAELAQERAAVAEALEHLGFTVRWFEEFGGRDDAVDAAYLGEVRTCTVYLGLLGEQYGSMLPSGPYAGFSATHAEYLEACAAGKRVSFWALEPAKSREGHTRRFLLEVQLFHVTGSFSGAHDLAANVERRLREIAADDLSPWVKLGGVVVRATWVVARGDELCVEARVFDEDVVHAIDELAGAREWRAPRIQVTHGNRSGQGEIRELAVQTTSAAFSDVTVTVSMDWSVTSDMPIGTAGYSAEDLTEVAVRVGLLRDPMPPQLGQMSFLVKAEDPLATLAGVGVPEDNMRALARLLITEWLVSDGRASIITSFALGPSHGGERHIELTWREPRRYSNVESKLRTVSGIRRR